MESNDDRRAGKLADKIRRQHKWRVQVWAQTQVRINKMLSQMAELGHEGPDLFEPDFEDAAKLATYTTLLRED